MFDKRVARFVDGDEDESIDANRALGGDAVKNGLYILDALGRERHTE